MSVNGILYLGKVCYHSVLVKIFGTAIYGYYGIVPVQAAAFAFIVQIKPVGEGYFKSFGNVIHILVLILRAKIIQMSKVGEIVRETFLDNNFYYLKIFIIFAP